ncbi:MAG: zinc ABC transporter substrate-binding protein [Spirochaetes bacterium]|nr:zinc ABC transporter substrate-binding protein [Spirochaetota bacterium]
MTKKICIVTAIISLMCPWGCKKPDESAAAGGIRVAVSVFPLHDMARAICGDRGSAFFVVPAGADPHSFEPRPSIARTLENTTLFIGVTPEFDGWVERYLPASAARVYLMERRKGEPEANPHIWLSVKKAREIAAVMAKQMSAVDPANGEYYRNNLKSYDRKLDDLDRAIAALFANKTRKSFIQWHESWNYFAADYGLAITGTVQREGSEKASVRSMKEIVDRARLDRVTAIVVSLSSEERTARVLAGEIGGSIVKLDGIGDPASSDRSTYLKLMEYNSKKLAGALR